jgi:hypothetical protein
MQLTRLANTIILPVYSVLLILLGIVLIWSPARVQRLAIKWVASGVTGRMRSLQHFVASKAYVWNVRAIGAVALFMGLFLLWARSRSSS